MRKLFCLAGLIFVVTAASLSALPPGPVFCGDWCEPEGASRGCILSHTGVWVRVPCTCENGVWDCTGW